MPRAILDEVELQYELKGAGPRLLVISGTGGDLRAPPNVFDSPLANCFEILTYDQRGLGRSSLPQGPYAMDEFAEDAAALMLQVGWDNARVIGKSFGGMVAQELAIRRPEMVGRLALCCTSSGGMGGSSFPLHELSDLSEDERELRRVELANTNWDAPWRAANPVALANLLSDRRTRAAIGKDEPGRNEGAALQLEARSHHDTYGRLNRITAPTVVCGGRFDGIAPTANVENLAHAIPGAELHFFNGGHSFLEEDPAAYPALIEFLSRT